MAANTKLIAALRTSFATVADADKAAPMQAYMKSALPFHGIAAPLQRRLTAEAVKTHPCKDVRSLATPCVRSGVVPAFAKSVTPRRSWANGDDLWLRRASFLCQRKLKSAFDARLFYETILPSIGEHVMAREFFLRKGIGWALRERSYRAPDEVQAFCREYEARLSPLTRREALRVILKRVRA